MHTRLRANRNSFASCFQFDEVAKTDGLFRRVKIYDKGLALLTTSGEQIRSSKFSRRSLS